MAAFAAERDLLFGLLALQNGLIDQIQLVAAFQAWTRDKARPLAEHLAARGDLDHDQRAGVEAMVGLHLKKHGGDDARSLAAIPAGRSTRESLAALCDPAIEQSLTQLASGSDGDPDRTASYAVGIATSDGQRFRVLRPHARGGLGTVFVALDAELHREVALKQILDEHADDPASRQRFLIEAEITGGLEHPGIVPVYGLGSYGDGRPYYAMRFIRGDSLKEAIERYHADESFKHDPGRRSLELRKLLRRFLDVCNAIEYAHSRGVLHRDIKPGNVIVGKHGETLVVNWGLAKPLGKVESAHDSGERTLRPSSASGSAETLPGSALGTPAYMSPEQAAGDLDRLGLRSDVYSLGATLYCLLTGKPPFEGDVFEVLPKVQRGEFARPRQLDPSIDEALEAVCLKAMATEPGDRYASCRGLGEDVERWTADESVSAWREPLARRGRRWARRHWPLVTAAVAAVLVALAGLGAVLAVQRGANRALAAKNADLDRANVALREAVRQKDAANAALAEANERVQARFELAREAIRSFKAGVEEEEALKEDRLRPLRDKLLGSARRFYDRMGDLLEGQSDAGSKAVLAESYTELGELIDKIGQKPEALAAFRKAVAIRRDLAARPGSGASARVELARALNGLGGEAVEVGDHAGALAVYEEARALAEPLAAGPGATIEARRALGSALEGSGAALEATGKVVEALAAFRRAREVLETLARDGAAVPDDRSNLAGSLASIGDLLERTGDLAGALAEQRKNQELMRAVAAEHPAVPEYRRNLAVSHSRVGLLLEATGDLAGALAERRRGHELFQALVAEHPDVPGYRSDLAVSHNVVGGLLERTGDLAGALAEQRRYQELFQALAAEHPEVTQYRYDLAVSHSRVGNLLTTDGRPAEALPELESARSLLEALARDGPNVPDYRDALAFALNSAGGALPRPGPGRRGPRPPRPGRRPRRRAGLGVPEGAGLPRQPGRRAEAARPAQAGCRRRRRGRRRCPPSRRAARGAVRARWEAVVRAGLRRATLAAAGGRDGSGPSTAEAPSLADRAMDDLRRAAAMGYRNAALYRYEPALAPLRGREDFRLLLLDLAFPDEPFAAAR